MLIVLFAFGIFSMLSNSASGEQLPLPIFHRLLKNSLERDILQEEKCPGNQCYQIYDMLLYRDYRPAVARVLGFTYPSPNAHSVYELVFPTDLSIENLNSRNWKPRKTFIEYSKYFITMCEAPFWSGVIPRNSTESHNILLIGVAGANMNNYWAATYPQLNITAVELNPLLVELGSRWFSVDLNDRHRILTEDGAVFVKKAAERGENYQAIVLDATYDDVNREVTSPVDVFRQPDILRAISQILEPSGILFVNIVIGEKTDSRLSSLDKVVKDFMKVFKFVEVFFSEDFNSVMLCRQNPIDASQLKNLPKVVPYNDDI